MESTETDVLASFGELFTDPKPLPDYLAMSDEELADLPELIQFWVMTRVRKRGRGRPRKLTKCGPKFFEKWAEEVELTVEYKERARIDDEGMMAYRIIVEEMLRTPEVEKSMRDAGFWKLPGQAREKQIYSMAKAIKQSVYRLKKNGT